MTQPSHPMQPVVLDAHGVARFKANAILEHLYASGVLDLNAILRLDVSDEDRMQFAQLLGYSVSSFAELPFAADDMVAAADAAADSFDDQAGPADPGEEDSAGDPQGGPAQQWAREHGPEHVFILQNNGTTTPGVFRSVAGAQARALEILRGYQEQYAALTPAEREETEDVTAELDWALERDRLRTRDGYLPMGQPHPVAHYSDSSAFAIRAQPVHD